MPFSHVNSRGRTYYLHAKTVTLTNGREQVIYWFAPRAGADAIEEAPPGYCIEESVKTGLPRLKRAVA